MTTTAHKPIDDLFAAGAHYGYRAAKRHPSAQAYIFGVKGAVEIFDLEKTADALETAKNFVKEIASHNKQILFVGGKHEAQAAVRQSAEGLNMPYVAGR